jgi:hypothetical protein
MDHKYNGGVRYENVAGKIFIDPWNNGEASANINFVIDNLPELNFNKQNWIFNANGMYGSTKEIIHKFDLDFYKKCESMFTNKPSDLNMVEFAFERINQLILL